MPKRQSLTTSTPLLQKFARDISVDVNHIAVAKRHNLPLYEVVSGNTTLELTRFMQHANQLFDKCNTVKIFKVTGTIKSLWRYKKNGKEKSFDNAQTGI